MNAIFIKSALVALPALVCVTSCSDSENRELPVTMQFCAGLNAETPAAQALTVTLRGKLEAWQNHKGELEDCVTMLIFLAAQSRAGDEALLEAVKELQEAGADIRVPDEKGTTGLLYAAFGGFRQTLDYLLDEGLPLDDTNDVGCTPLMMAAQGGHVDMIRYLQAKEQSLSATDKLGNNALIYAAYGGHLDCIRYLLDRGQNIRSVNTNGLDCLIAAAHSGNVECCRFFMEQGLNVQSCGYDGVTAPMYAAWVAMWIVSCFWQSRGPIPPRLIPMGIPWRIMRLSVDRQSFCTLWHNTDLHWMSPTSRGRRR